MTEGDVRRTDRREGADANTDVEWVVSVSEGGLSFRWGYLGEELVAEWEGILTVRATRDGELKALDPSPDASRDLVEKTRRGAVTAFLRAQRKQHSLHASSVSLGGHAMACVGASGLGKSTIAERLCAQAGAELLADDIAAVELVFDGSAMVVPTESALWLGSAASEVKVPRVPSRVAAAPSPLRWVVALAFDEACSRPEAHDLRGADAVSVLLPALIRFERTAELWARELEFLQRLVSQCRIVLMKRSRGVGAEAVARVLCALTREDAR
jgi:hypothetical protein